VKVFIVVPNEEGGIGAPGISDAGLSLNPRRASR
jgi:hypothetical protein